METEKYNYLRKFYLGRNKEIFEAINENHLLVFITKHL